MSVHSVDHMGPPLDDDGYRGYDIDAKGQVIEFYDHTNDFSDHGGHSGISASRRLLSEAPSGSRRHLEDAPSGSRRVLSEAPSGSRRILTEDVPSRRPTRNELKATAGCCSCCVDCLITIGRLPLASIFCFILMWIGTGLFIGAGWAVLDTTQDLFTQYGPGRLNGNPAMDPPPEYFLVRDGVQSSIGSHYELRDPRNPGNRVPEVFLGIQRSFYGIIPFMVLFSFIVIADGAASTTELQRRRRGCKTSSAGICCSIFVILCSYLLLLAWVFWLAFATLGVYYYRIVMLRCEDLRNPIRSEGETKDICVDLVQVGLIMFRSTTDEYFGKICGPGATSRSVGDLDGYCNSYQHAWQLMLVCWAGLLINIIAMMHSLTISASNYRALQLRLTNRRQRVAHASRSPAVSHRTETTHLSTVPSRPPVVVGTNGDTGRRYSRDYELDEMNRDSDFVSSSVSYNPRKRFANNDSHAGVDYYYKDH